MAKVIIHIGTHKTGTTTIQNFFRFNQEKLKEQSIVYLEAESNPVFHSLRAKNKESRESLSTWIRNNIDVNSNNLYFISWEGLSGDYNTGYSDTKYYADVLGNSFREYDTSILCYFRRQDSLIESLYTQTIHEGKSHSFDGFLDSLEKESNLFEWDKFLDNYLEYFKKGKIIAKIYDKSKFKNGSLIEDVCHVLNIDFNILSQPEMHKELNQGYSRQALEFARVCNPSLDDKQRLLLRRLLQTTNSKKPFENYTFFNDKRRIVFFESFKESNNVFYEKYLDNEYFQEPLSLDDKSNSDSYKITQNDINGIILKIVLELYSQQNILTQELISMQNNQQVSTTTINALQKQNEEIINVINQIVNAKF